MAVAFGSAGTFSSYASGTNLTLVAPSSIADGDLLLAFLAIGGSPAPTVTAPGGWTALPGSPSTTTGGGFHVKYYIFYKIASSEAGNYTFTHATANRCGIVVRYTGVDTSAPFSPTPTLNTGSFDVATALGFTTAYLNTFVIFTESDWSDNSNDTVVPTGTTPTFTERLDGNLIYIADGTLASPSATGDKSHTCNNTNGAANKWNAFLIGLKAADATDIDSWKSAVTAAGGSVSVGRQTLVQNLIDGLKTDGIWTKLDRLWLFAAENSQSALIDLRVRATATAVNTPTFTANLGYQGNGSSSYINSGYNPTTHAINFSQNSACAFVWKGTSGQDAGNIIGGSINNHAIPTLNPQYLDGVSYWSVNCGGVTFESAGLGAGLQATGLFNINRSAAGQENLYKDGVSLQSGNQASAAVTNETVFVLSGGGYFSSHQAACAGLGGSLNSTEQAALYTRLNTYMSGVIAGGTSTLTLHYEFENSSVTDSSGNINTGTIAGSGTTVVTGKIGNALSFNGSGYVTFTSVGPFALVSGTSEKSVCCWVKLTATDAVIHGVRDGSGTVVLDFVIGYNGVNNNGTGKPSLIVRDGAGGGLTYFSASTAVNDGNWHHVAFTRTSGKVLTLYVDGAAAGTATDTMAVGSTPDLVTSAIGRDPQNTGLSWFNGLLDDFRVYNSALTSTEIAAIYAAGGGATTLTAAAGSYTLTGASAGLAGKAVAASGSYTITGTAAALKRGQVTPAGSYTITGTTAALLRKQVAAVGSYTLTGTAATFVATANLVFPAAAGSYTLTGAAAAFQIGGNVVLATDPGAYTLTGTAATFAISGNVVLAAAAGAYTLTGSPASFVISGEQPPIQLPGGGGGVTVPPYIDYGRKKRRRYRALEEIEKRLDERIARLEAETKEQQQQVAAVLFQATSITVVPDQLGDLLRRQAQVTQMLHEAQRRAEKVRQERIELAILARQAAEAADEDEAITMLLLA